MTKRISYAGLAFVSAVFLSTVVWANEKPSKGKRAQATSLVQVDLSACEALLGDGQITRYAHLTESWTLADLLNPDPTQNLAAKYPSIVMNNAQQDWYALNKYPRTRVKDPAYRRAIFYYYPVLSAGIPEAMGHQIIGHYESMQHAAAYIEAKAKGKRASKMLGFVGPAGTGKTEIGNLLERVKANLANNDPDYYRFTFEFVGLDDIGGLKALLYGADEEGNSPTIKDVSLNRSPFVLLPPAVQKRLVEIVTPAFRSKMEEKKIPMNPIPFATPSNKTQRVIDAIIAHYQKAEGKATISDRDYLRWLSPHVRIVRRVFDTIQPPAIIRYLGKHPDMNTLYFTENLALSQYYGPKDPLSYAYGIIPSNDGKGLFIDEFFRQTGDVRESTLDLAQNQVAQNGGAPAELLDVTIYFATNDESIDSAREDGGANAHLSRTIRLPMRHALEPWHVVKIALMDIGTKSFKVRKLKPSESAAAEAEESDTVLQPLDLQSVIPDLESGELLGSDGRYALYYQHDPSDKPVLIAPRSLLMMGLLASATRMVTDQKTFVENAQHFSTLAKFSQYFLDPMERLHVLMGTKQVEAPVIAELMKARDMFREGQSGIGAREVENWISIALEMAKSQGGSLTPVTVDRAFAHILNKGQFVVKTSSGSNNRSISAKESSQWITLMQGVKSEFILTSLTTDVLSIVQGRGRAEALYDDLKREIFALSRDKEADYIDEEGNHRIPIDRKRLVEIYRLFAEIANVEFDPGMLKDFHLQVSAETVNPRHPALLEAVRRYLAQKEMDMSTISELVSFFEGRPVSETVRASGSQAERQMQRYGYDRSSFLQALMFVRDQRFLIEKGRSQGSR